MLLPYLHRVKEELPVYSTEHELVQEKEALHSMLHVATETPGTLEVICELTTKLGCYFGVYRVTLVLLSSGNASVATRFDSNECEPGAEYPIAFTHHSQVLSLLAPNRKLIFLNSFGISAYKATFVSDETVSLCILPLRDNQELHGYMIFENRDRRNTFKTGTESSLFYVAKIVSERLSEIKRNPERNPEKFENNAESPEVEERIDKHEESKQGTDSDSTEKFIIAARSTDGLYVDSALEVMGGLAELYERSVRLFDRSAQNTIEKLDAYLSTGDIQAFTIEIHGIKGALNNIGATELGAMASRLETASKNADLAYCSENYTVFRNALILLCERLAVITRDSDTVVKKKGDTDALASALREALEAARSFDSVRAQEMTKATAALSATAKNYILSCPKEYIRKIAVS